MKKFLMGAAVSASMLVGCEGDILVVGGTGDASSPSGERDAAGPVVGDGGSPARPDIPTLAAIPSAPATVGDGCGCTPPPGYVDGAPDAGTIKTYDHATAQIYVGYLESFKLASGSDRVLVALAPDATAGTIFFGDGPVLGPPTGPDTTYPPGLRTDPLSRVENFPFSLLNGRRSGDRLTFESNGAEVAKQWCEIQPTVYASCAGDTNAFEGYGCMPNATTMEGINDCAWSNACGTHPIDCGTLTYCRWLQPCTCTSHGCTVNMNGRGDLQFDLVVSGAVATGSVTGLSSVPVRVHLTAQ
jgi:hypothetical protein